MLALYITMDSPDLMLLCSAALYDHLEDRST